MRKVVLVTGSSRGIGAACILGFAKKGYDVVINYQKDETRARELQAQVMEDYHVNALCIKADVSSGEACKQMIEEILTKYGRIDVLVNNAGMVVDKPLLERTSKEFLETLSTNLIGPFELSKLVSKHMIKNGGSSLIFLPPMPPKRLVQKRSIMMLLKLV